MEIYQKIFENFRLYVEDSTNRKKKKPRRTYSIHGILTMRRGVRNKEDVLAAIRGVVGVTITAVDSAKNTEKEELSEIRVKINMESMKHVRPSEAIRHVIKKINHLDGVRSFKLISTPKALD